MREAVIVSTARTGLAKSWRGALNQTHGAKLGGHVVHAALERANYFALSVVKKRAAEAAIERPSLKESAVHLLALAALAQTAREPGQDTSAIFSPRLDRLVSGRPPLLTARWPETTGLASYLSGCVSPTGQRYRL